MVAESHVFLYSLPVFALVDALAYFVLFKNLKGTKRFEAASCCVSFIHGIAVVVLCSYDLMSTYPWKLDAPNTSLENNIMEFSLAYFAIDMLYYIFINPSDYLFILHHIATSSYMISCRYYAGRGGVSTISLMCTGEATSPFENVWTLARTTRGESPFADRIYVSLSPVFTVYFTIMRCVAGPSLASKLCSFYIPGNADKVIPRGLAYFWMVTVLLAIVGSSVWFYKLWAGLIKFYGKKRSKSHQSKIHKAE